MSVESRAACSLRASDVRVRVVLTIARSSGDVRASFVANNESTGCTSVVLQGVVSSNLTALTRDQPLGEEWPPETGGLLYGFTGLMEVVP